jgi:hypothetical protein
MRRAELLALGAADAIDLAQVGPPIDFVQAIRHERVLARRSRIWALHVHRGEKVRHVLTVEVDMKRRAVVQARGCRCR